MSRIVEVRGMRLGEGAPKICVPLVGRTKEALREEAELLREIDLDIVEWRVDHFGAVDSVEDVLEELSELRGLLGETPLLFTFRSAREGGARELSADDYIRLNRAAAASGQVDAIDIELFSGDDAVREFTAEAHRRGVVTFVSNHDFDKTPPQEEMESRLRRARELGGDVPKIAVMPRDPGDVLSLLAATYRVSSEGVGPVITMSMAESGAVSRVAGGAFGSALTFGAAKQASAPGQLAAPQLRGILDALYGG